MPYTLTDESLAELKELYRVTGDCPFAGVVSIRPCPVCERGPRYEVVHGPTGKAHGDFKTEDAARAHMREQVMGVSWQVRKKVDA